jgi:8-oxo-dGTP pyrophosphatase MutT (NUDIX family)
VTIRELSVIVEDVNIFPVDRLDLRFVPYRWKFAQVRRDDIAAHFAMRRAASPALWNGRVLLMRDHSIAESMLRGAFFETSFADFTAWRDWEFPDRDVVNCFAMGALRASDGAYLLGVMSPHTVNPGRIYFPAGTPDPSDRRGDTVDLDSSVLREVAEETGLTEQDYVVTPGWTAVVTGPSIALMKRLDVPGPAEAVRRLILRHLVDDPKSELADIRVVRSTQDFDPMMPLFVTAYLSHVWTDGT